jgi:hypothetical protein
MLKLLIHQLKFSPFCLFCLGVGWITYFVDRKTYELFPQAAYMLGFFLAAGAVSTVINRELRDFTGGGYSFFKILPLSDLEIVSSKFLAFVLDVTCSWTLVVGLFITLPAERMVLPLSLTYITAWSLCTVLAISIWYVCTYRFGFGISTFILSLFLVLFLLPFSLILDQTMDFSSMNGFPRLINELSDSNWLIWFLIIALTFFFSFALFKLASHFKKTREQI